jgi:hypothetical protein
MQTSRRAPTVDILWALLKTGQFDLRAAVLKTGAGEPPPVGKRGERELSLPIASSARRSIAQSSTRWRGFSAELGPRFIGGNTFGAYRPSTPRRGQDCSPDSYLDRFE